MLAKSVRDLEVYKMAFEAQQDIFEMSKAFPKEEMYSLTDQIRRSSRSVGANISESWAKRRYPAHFVSKLSDAEGEAEETLHWLKTALACNYIAQQTDADIADRYTHIIGMLNKMMSDSAAWCGKLAIRRGWDGER
jgi:four helix bundle protein